MARACNVFQITRSQEKLIRFLLSTTPRIPRLANICPFLEARNDGGDWSWPLLPQRLRLNRLSNPYSLGEFILILGLMGGIFSFFQFNRNSVSKQWRPLSDSAFCGLWSGSALLPMLHKKTLRLVLVNAVLAVTRGIRKLENVLEDSFLHSKSKINSPIKTRCRADFFL